MAKYKVYTTYPRESYCCGIALIGARNIDDANDVIKEFNNNPWYTITLKSVDKSSIFEDMYTYCHGIVSINTVPRKERSLQNQ